jgi:anti-sigma factor ChrR (cupin superfamily)
MAPAAELPSPRVKEALMARVRAAKATTATSPAKTAKTVAPAGWRFEALASAEGWLPLPIPGVRIREVTVDRERDTALLYVEMAPGSIFPEHVHSAPERGLVLTGDFKTDQQLLHAGDFYEADAGTPHVRISSPSGCTGLLWVSAKAWQHWQVAMAAR